MTMVIQKQVDATINAETSVQDYIKTTGTKDIKVIDRSEEATAYAMPLPKGSDNASLLKAVNEALAVLRADGTLAKISEKYFGSDLTNE
jgi:cystine transport system substrate-binding protein